MDSIFTAQYSCLLTTSSSLFILLLLLHFSQTTTSQLCQEAINPHQLCPPSSCGIISNISYPFRLKGDPKHCGDRRFELACEDNVTSIYFDSHKFYVKAINYDNSTIRVVDASLNNDDICSFPAFSTMTSVNYDFYGRFINFMSCPNPLKNSSNLFTNVTDCATSSNSSASHRYAYIKVGHMSASELPEMCTLEKIVETSWEFKDLNSTLSLSEIHHSLLGGFELIVCPTTHYTKWGILLVPLAILGAYLTILSSLAPRIVIFPFIMWFLIYKFRRRHLSMYNKIERFLQSDNKLTAIRYSYSDIRKMTSGFRDKLGEGGYGAVYKGKLQSGYHVAVKLLGKSGASDQDFMNEIATIGRIHHVNVVKLVGYCAQGSKRALVYDFMPNGSLEKYLFNRDTMVSLNMDTKFEIAVGVARGIEYLHRGCDVQILHFDIKPHNILLDDTFNPTISDFGLAKFFSTEKNTVTMTAARGTIGYVAPELINRSIGAVSYKADVYSFGMLLMEMVGLNRDLIRNHGDSSQYFPNWIYDHINQGKDIEIGKVDENYDDMKKTGRKMTIVALWCIRMSPDDRPSMNEVLQMLEGDVEHLQIPDYPCQSAQIEMNVDQSGITSYTSSLPLLHHVDASSCFEITVQD